MGARQRTQQRPQRPRWPHTGTRVGRARIGSARLPPLRRVVLLTVPAFVLYSVLAITLARTVTAGTQLLLLCAGCCVLMLGSWITPTARFDHRLGTSLAPISLRTRAFVMVFVVGVLSSIASYLTNGIALLSSDAANERLENFSNGYIGTVAVTSLSVTLILAAALAFDPPRSGRRLPWIVCAAIAFALLLGFSNRGMFVVPVLTVIALQLMKHPKRIVPLALIGACLVLAVSVLGYERDLQLYGPSHLENLMMSGIPRGLLWLAPVIDYLRGTSVAVDLIIRSFPATIPHPHGSVFFSALLSPLPGNQVPPGVFLKEALGMNFVGSGLAAGAFGGFYMDFGPLGVLVGFFLLGIIAKLAQNYALRHQRGLTLCAYVVAHFWFMNFSHPLPFFTTLTIPLVLALLIAGPTDAEARRHDLRTSVLPSTPRPRRGR